MQVKDLMTKKVFTIEPNDMIDRVFFLIHYEKLRHLPVVEKGKVVGIVSDRDMYKALGPKSNSKVIESNNNNNELHVVAKKVRHIMKRGIITVTPNTPASEAAKLMTEHRIGALPVVNNGKLAGILTSTDILKVFSKLDSAQNKKNNSSEKTQSKKG
ncbi:MAG: CBS domain-containing protein [Methylococcaceae bacterium]|nr:CBS domain-containing protein [Methylococcaceae bacterium]